MAENTPPPSNTPEGGGKKPPLQLFRERFQALPKAGQYALIGVGVLFVLMFFMGGDDTPQQERQAATGAQVKANLRGIEQGAANTGANDAFSTVDVDREALQRNFVAQQQVALAELRDAVRSEQESLRAERNRFEEEKRQRELELSQLLGTVQQQMQSLEEANMRSREEITRLAEEARRSAPAPGTAGQAGGASGQNQQVPPRLRTRITQTPLGARQPQAGPQVGEDQALLAPVRRIASGEMLGASERPSGTAPFVPPLGFVKGTMLNGVDALAGGGRATPALVRLRGVYKTAMNSSVSLNGCFAMVEFQGDVSTERALGRPSRMTCVYPDQGAVTYDISGYVVDAKDGIIGVPGVFFEGDAGRIASAMLAEFAAGVAAIIRENQYSVSENTDGVATETITGDRMKAELAGGAAQAVGSLRDYLVERANRVMPFVRIDATRDIHLVFLSGTELREAGSPWTLLFNANASP